MEAYADAVIGVRRKQAFRPDSINLTMLGRTVGLNVEQRKCLTIGVELAAKPDLLLFLDERTSGLDSQTAWSIARLLRKL